MIFVLILLRNLVSCVVEPGPSGSFSLVSSISVSVMGRRRKTINWPLPPQYSTGFDNTSKAFIKTSSARKILSRVSKAYRDAVAADEAAKERIRLKAESRRALHNARMNAIADRRQNAKEPH